MSFFSIDGPAFRWGTILFDMVYVSVLWFLTVILTAGFGLGAATATLIYTVDKCILNDLGSITKDYFKMLKKNLFKGILVWIPIALLMTIISWRLFTSTSNGVPTGGIVNNILVFVLLFLTLWAVNIVALMSKVDYPKVKDFYINSLFIGLKHFSSSAKMTIATVLVIVTGIIVPPSLGILAGMWAMYVAREYIGKVLPNYYSEEDLKSYN